MRLGLAAASLLLSVCLPLAAAQAPAREELVPLACGTVGGVEPQARDLIPLCAERAEPQPSAQPDDEPAAPPQAPPTTPETAEQLAQDVVEEAERLPEDPAAAPERRAAGVAAVVGFLRELLEIPGAAAASIGAALADAGDAVGGAFRGAGEAVEGAAASAVDATKAAMKSAGEALAAALDALRPDVSERARGPPSSKLPVGAEAADELIPLRRRDIL